MGKLIGYMAKQKAKTAMKHTITAILAGAMIITSCIPAGAATNELKQINTSPITSGVVQTNYTWDIADGMVKASVLEIDLTNPYVQLDIVPGQGQFTKRFHLTATDIVTDTIHKQRIFLTRLANKCQAFEEDVKTNYGQESQNSHNPTALHRHIHNPLRD